MNEELSRCCERYPALEPCRADMESALAILAAAFQRGRKLLVCGNGGSAADADHITGELMKGFLLPRPVPHTQYEALRNGSAAGERLVSQFQGALPAIALSSQGALMTAIANDINADLIFAQQVHGLGACGDVLMCLSTSGNSLNVTNAALLARHRGLKVIALTGRSGGALAPLADAAILVPADSVVEIQELHLPVYHALCAALEAHFFGSADATPGPN